MQIQCKDNAAEPNGRTERSLERLSLALGFQISDKLHVLITVCPYLHSPHKANYMLTV